jgi:hypothetical protein
VVVKTILYIASGLVVATAGLWILKKEPYPVDTRKQKLETVGLVLLTLASFGLFYWAKHV